MEIIRTLNHMPDEAKDGRLLIEKHLAESSIYRQSYEEATKRLERIMESNSPSWVFPENLVYMEGMIFREQLGVASVCPRADTRELILQTACRVLPYGCVSAKTYEYAPGRSYIHLDTGTGDFYGNMAALIFALFEQEYHNHDYGLIEQTLISKFWGLALIYYDYGFETNNEALLYPHFRFSELTPTAEPYARLMSNSALYFYLFHEFGHIVDRMLGDFTGKEQDEYSADFFSFTAIRESAFRDSTYHQQKIEFLTIGCILALAAIDFIESTFPGQVLTRGGRQISFPEPSTAYPSAKSRLDVLLGTFPSEVRNQLDHHNVLRVMRNSFEKYSNLIRAGAQPSPWYWDWQETKLREHKEGRTTSIAELIKIFQDKISTHEDYLFGLNLYCLGLDVYSNPYRYADVISISDSDVPDLRQHRETHKKALEDAKAIMDEVIRNPYKKLSLLNDIRLPSIQGTEAHDKLFEIVMCVMNTYSRMYPGTARKAQFTKRELLLLMDRIFEGLPTD